MTNTSLEALFSVDTTRLEDLVLGTVRRFGKDGCTADDVRKVHPELSYSSVTARPASLLRKGLITRGPDTRVGVSGRRQRVMRAV